MDTLTKVFSWRRRTEDLYLWYQFGPTNSHTSNKFRAPRHAFFLISSFCWFFFTPLWFFHTIFVLHFAFVWTALRFVVTCPSCSEVCGSEMFVLKTVEKIHTFDTMDTMEYFCHFGEDTSIFLAQRCNETEAKPFRMQRNAKWSCDRTREYKRFEIDIHASWNLWTFACQVANGTRTDEALLGNSNSLSQWSHLGCNECCSFRSLPICHHFLISSNCHNPLSIVRRYESLFKTYGVQWVVILPLRCIDLRTNLDTSDLLLGHYFRPLVATTSTQIGTCARNFPPGMPARVRERGTLFDP